MTMRKLVRVGAVALAVSLGCAVASPPAGAESVYVTGIGNEFGTLDLASGSFSQIATLALPDGDFIFGMGFGADGNLYGVDAQPDAHLWQINPGNGGLTDLGAIGQSALDATSDTSGKLYVLSQDVNAIYYTMNPPSATPTVIGAIGISSGGLMAVSADGKQLFTTTPSTTTSTYNLVAAGPALERRRSSEIRASRSTPGSSSEERSTGLTSAATRLSRSTRRPEPARKWQHTAFPMVTRFWRRQWQQEYRSRQAWCWA